MRQERRTSKRKAEEKGNKYDKDSVLLSFVRSSAYQVESSSKTFGSSASHCIEVREDELFGFGISTFPMRR